MSPSTRPLAYREFRWLWLAAVVSNVGSFLQVVAATWLMLQLTGSALWVGLMVASPTLPLLLVALPAGAMADLVDRRRVMLAAHAVMAAGAAAMALLYLAGGLSPGLLLALGLLVGTGQAFNLPSWQATVSDLVPSDVVASAVALNSAAFNVARAVGPALGGLVVAILGPGAAFALNAASYLPVAAAVAALDRRTAEPGGGRMRHAISEGVRYARHTPAYRWVLLLVAAFALTSAVVQAVLPTFTALVLSGGAGDYGLLLGAMGAGALVGAVTRERVSARLAHRMVPLAIAAFGLLGVALGLARTLPLALAPLLGAGVLWVWILATLNATAQLLSPAWVRGRIMSLYTVSFLGILPLGSVLAGALAGALGPSAALVVFSGATLALGVLAARVPLPNLREARPPQRARDWRPPPHPVAVDAERVMVLTTWVIDEGDLDDFLAVMDELRRVRLRTGAFRWRLYRNVGDAHRMTEAFLLPSWDAHLRQHRRIDAEAAAVLRRARAFDRAGGPLTHHLADVDVAQGRRPGWEALVAVHERMHRSDGSVPLAPAAPAADGAPAGDGGREHPARTTDGPARPTSPRGSSHADRHPDRRR